MYVNRGTAIRMREEGKPRYLLIPRVTKLHLTSARDFPPSLSLSLSLFQEGTLRVILDDITRGEDAN